MNIFIHCKGINKMHDRNNVLKINLSVARDDILMGLHKHFHQMESEISEIIEKEFEEFSANYRKIIRAQVHKEVSDIINSSISSYLKHGEGGSIIKSSVEKALGDKIKEIVENTLNKENIL